jgi:peptidoglycan-N-acetylglucosamine deacetylase
VRGVSVTLAVLLVAVCGLAPAGVAVDDEFAPAGPTLRRVAGPDRYATSAAISAEQFPNPAAVDAVYLASGQVLADALVAGTVTDGPVLLVPRCSGVPATVAAEIARLDPATVYAVGGTGAVCGATLAKAAGTRPRVRIAGPDRAATAAAVAQHVFPGGAPTVYLARGANSVDAVAGGTLTGGPILLTGRDGTTLPAATTAAIEALGPDRVVALGGAGAVSAGALAQAAAGRPASRLAGADRYATSTAIARQQFPRGSPGVYLARGDGSSYVDAVAAGVLTRGPVLLVNGPCDWLPSSVASYLATVRPTRVTALGGTGSICEPLLRQAARAASPPVDCAKVTCVALTFDDGPSAHTARLLDVLAERGVPATWFVQGVNVRERPALTRRIAMEGHQVENHTWDHPQLNLLSLSGQRSQLDRTDSAVRSAGAPRTDRLRPPYGAYNANTRNLGLPLVLWSVDSEDWRTRVSSSIRQQVRATVHPGAIVLQHDTIGPSVDAVPGIVADLWSRGYTFVTVDELVPNMRPGDLVYRRGWVVPAGEYADPSTVFTVDGMPFGPVWIDPEAVPGDGE